MLKNNKIILLFLIFFLAFASRIFSQEEYAYDAKGKRDPFIPLVSADGVLVKLDKEEDTDNSLAIEGIIYDKQGSSYAIVGGQIVRVGDPVQNGYRVLKIEQNKIIFIKEGQPMEVILKEAENENK